MAKKPKQRAIRTQLRAASKIQEAALQAKADALMEDPTPLVPVCHGHRSHFWWVQRGVGKVWESRGNLRKLGFRSRWGPPIARAFAATLLAAGGREDQIIMLQVKTPIGTFPIASRGKAKRDHLLGVQYFDDRQLRLFLVRDLARTKGLAFYSMPDGGIACGGKHAKPPEAFVAAEAQALGLLKDPEGWGCAHAIHADERLALHWKPAGVRLRKCAACAREGNTLHTLVQHIAANKVLEGFEVTVRLAPMPEKGASPVPLPAEVPLDPSALERYKKGELDDAGLLRAQRQARVAHLRTLPGPLYVNAGVSYGKDAEAFIASLQPKALEETALRAAFEDHDKPVVVEAGTPAKVLAELWQARGLAMLEAISGSAEVARSIHEAHDVAGKGVGPALQQAQARGQRAAAEAGLPAYQGLPPAALLADQVARAHRAHGRRAALDALEQGAERAPKGVVHALELALDAGAGKGWKYSPTEVDLAQTLLPKAKALLAAGPSDYDAALRALAAAAGVSEALRRA
jgi:hypothetical protein